jgi:hypothetical protein
MEKVKGDKAIPFQIDGCHRDYHNGGMRFYASAGSVLRGQAWFKI